MKKTNLALLFVLLVGLLATCQSTSNRPALPNAESQNGNTDNAQASHVTITFACYRFLMAEFTDLAVRFHDTHPNIHLNIVAIEDIAAYGPDFDPTAVTREIVSAADAAQWTATPLASREGLLLDLTPFMEADTRFNAEDFYPNMLESISWDGGTWAMPAFGSLSLLYYDQATFDEAGIAYPSTNWTLEDFLTTAQALTQETPAGVTRYGFVDYAGGLRSAVIHQHVPATLDAMPDQTLEALSAPETTAAMQWYVDLAMQHRVMPNPTTLGSDENEQAKALTVWVHGDLADNTDHGHAAMWTDLLSNYTMNKARHARVGIAPLPGKESRAAFSLWESYIASAGTTHPEEVWQWLVFLSEQPATGMLVSNEIPARRSNAEQNHYWARWQEKEADVIRYALERTFVSHVPEVEAAVYEASRNVLAGTSVEQALHVAQADVTDAYNALTKVTVSPVTVKTPEPTPMGSVTINFATTQITEYRALAKAFREAQPDVLVNVVGPGGAVTPDCFADYRQLALDTERSELLNLQPLVDADKDFSSDIFHPQALEALRYQGTLWGLPWQASATGIFYNRDLFDAAGIPYPQPGWSLDEFTTAAIALTSHTGNEPQYGFVPLAHAIDVQYFVELHNLSLWDEQGHPHFDAPDVVAAVRRYTDLATLHQAMPTSTDDRQTLIRRGQAGMWSGISGIATFDQSVNWPKDADVGFAPLPIGARNLSLLTYEGLFIAADTPNSAACWEWFKFLNAPTTPAILSQGKIPAQPSALAGTEFLAITGEERIRTYQTMMDYAPALSHTDIGKAETYIAHLDAALENILTENMSVEAALGEAQQKAKQN